MNKSATDVMQAIIFSAVIDSITALRDASKGMPNALLRDVNAIHANVEFSDLPKEVQTAIASATRSAFNKLRHEGYLVSQETAISSRRNGNPNRNPNRRGS